MRTNATGKATANFLGCGELSPSESAGSGYESPGAVITWSLSLKHSQNSLCAVGGPSSDKTSVPFAQSLWGPHHPLFVPMRAAEPQVLPQNPLRDSAAPLLNVSCGVPGQRLGVRLPD